MMMMNLMNLFVDYLEDAAVVVSLIIVVLMMMTMLVVRLSSIVFLHLLTRISMENLKRVMLGQLILHHYYSHVNKKMVLMLTMNWQLMPNEDKTLFLKNEKSNEFLINLTKEKICNEKNIRNKYLLNDNRK
jgi:hypothetical protein